MESFHNRSLSETFKILNSSEAGLSLKESRLRLKKFGLNKISKKIKAGSFAIFLRQFKSPLVYILLISAAIAFYLKEALDAEVIISVVIFNSFFGLLHEIKAERAIEALSKIISLKTKVKRNGVFVEVPSSLVVPGDIVDINDGMKIPADIRIIEGFDITVNESSLTGESEPVLKKDIILPKDTDTIERVNILYAGTMVISGNGLGIVVATGNSTEFGTIAKEVETDEEETLLQKQVLVFSRRVMLVIVAACLYLFVIGIINNIHYLEMIMLAIAMAISAIPEGLPAVITVTLAYGAHKMAKRNAIVRRLAAIETLGAVTVIASDKTGTLTHNQQTIERIYLADGLYQVTGSGYYPEGSIFYDSKRIDPRHKPDLLKFITLGALCNNAKIFEKKGEWDTEGDPTEGAFVCLASKAHIDKDILEEKLPRLDEIPFETRRSHMSTLHSSKGENILIIKGAIEEVLKKSTYLLKNGKKVKLTRTFKNKILKAHDEFTRQALRVIAISYTATKKNHKIIKESDLDNLTFVGFAGMIDPPRQEAAHAIKTCKNAGIRPIIISGDFPLTAHAIARDIGIIPDDLEKAVTGQELEKMTKYEFSRTVKHGSVFARISPEMKYKIVQELQRQGEIVAVTGDGINDAPALEKADIGVAMGKGGTDVSREVADLVLVDNNFATIVAAIEEGRTIFQNIRRAVFYLLSTNAGELIVITLGVTFGWPTLLLPVQILWMNLVTDSAANLALSLEPTHPGVMKYLPRKSSEPILNLILLWRILFVSAIMAVLVFFAYGYGIKTGMGIDKIRTIVFSILIITQIYNIFNTRSLKESIFTTRFFSNPYIIFSFILTLVLSISTIYVSFMRNLFHTTSLLAVEWIMVMVISLFVIVVVEIDKLVRRIINSTY